MSGMVNACPDELHLCGTISREHPGEITSDLYSGDPQEIEKKEQAAAEMAVTKEEFVGGWTSQFPS